MKFKVKLRLTDSGGTRKKYSINLEDGTKFMIGRGTAGLGADLSHPSVSSAHCFLSIRDNLVWVTDNNSRNGTTLNQKRIDSASVRIGDMLQVGEYLIEFLEAPMPAKKDVASTQFIDLAEFSPEEQEALKRTGALGLAPHQGTQVMSRSKLFSRSKLIEPAKLEQEALAERNSVPKIDGPSESSAPRAAEPVLGELTPVSSPILNLEALEMSEPISASAPVPIPLPAPAPDPVKNVIADRKTDEIQRPAEMATPPKPEDPALVPETFMPAELMPTGMIQLKRPFSKKSKESKKESDETPNVVSKSDISGSTKKPATAPGNSPRNSKEALEAPESSAPKRPTSIPPAPSRRQDDFPPSTPDTSASEEQKKNLLVAKHLKKPMGVEAPAASDKKNRATDKKSEPAHAPVSESAAARVAKAPRGPRQKMDTQNLASAAIVFASFAACGAAACALGGSTFHAWIPPAYGAVGAAMVAGLAWLLSRYNEFMEADGDFRAYHRMLALTSVPVVLLGILSHASVLYRIPAFVLYGVIFFNVFMTRFKPLAERFLFLAGSYVASFAFILYVATSWDVIMNSATVPAAEVAAGESSAARTPAETTTAPAAVNTVPAHASDVATTGTLSQAQQTQAQGQTSGQAQGQTQAQAAADGAAATPHSSRPEPDSFAMSELLTAAQQGDSRIVRSLIQDKGVNPNTVAENGMTALMYAAYNGHIEVARALMASHADVNMRDRQGTSALMWAAYNGKRDMTALLVQSGSDLSAHRNDGDTALDIAKRWEHSDAAHGPERAEVVRLLENPALARAAHIPSDTAAVAAKPTAAPETVRVTTPPTARRTTASRRTTHRTPASKAKAKKLKTRRKVGDNYPATTSDDDSDARTRAVKSLKIGQ